MSTGAPGTPATGGAPGSPGYVAGTSSTCRCICDTSRLPPGLVNADISAGPLACRPTCPSKYTARSPAGDVRSFQDCTPLSCDSPLVYVKSTSLLASTLCGGCSNGTIGAPSNATSAASLSCAPCARSSPEDPFFCPGFTSVRVLSTFYALPDAYTSACSPLVGNFSLALVPPAIEARRFTFLTGLTAPDVAILIGILFAALVTALYVGTRYCCAAVHEHFKKVDLFSKNVWVPDNSPQVRQKRAIGGYYSLLGVTAFGTAALVLILTRSESNVTAVDAANILNQHVEAQLEALAFARDANWGSGISVRLAVAGEPSKCGRPLSFASHGYAASSTGAPTALSTWNLSSSTQSCGSTGASQLVFACARCSLSAASRLDLVFDSACQSFNIQVGALDAYGALSTVQASATSDPVAPNDQSPDANKLLTSVDFSVDVFSTLLNDTRAGAVSLRGYSVANGALAASFAPLEYVPGRNSSDQGFASSPPRTLWPTYATLNTAQQPVRVTISTRVNTMYASRVLTEKQSIASLLASICGVISIVGISAKCMAVNDYANRTMSGLGSVKTAPAPGDVETPEPGADADVDS